MSYSEFGELIMKLSRAALRRLLAAHERGALPLVGAAWGVTARKSSHNDVMPGVTLRARWDATLVFAMHIEPVISIAIWQLKKLRIGLSHAIRFLASVLIRFVAKTGGDKTTNSYFNVHFITYWAMLSLLFVPLFRSLTLKPMRPA